MKNPSLIQKAFLLKKTHLFEEMDLDSILAVTDKIDSVCVKEGQFLYQKGQVPKHIFIILEGCVELTYNDQTIKKVESGEILGELELFSNQNYTQSALCQSPTITLAFTKKQLSSIFAESPKIALTLIERAYKALNEFT